MALCRWLDEKEGVTYTAPTEAQWEYACRSGSTTRWYFGSNEADLQQYAWCAQGHTPKPVGLKLPNVFGLYDMHGNVWERCSDRFSEDYYYLSPENDPEGPAAGFERVLRGGWFSRHAWELRSACRSGSPPVFPRYYVGFRPVQTLP